MWKFASITGLALLTVLLASCSDDDSGGSGSGAGAAGNAGAGAGFNVGGSSGVGTGGGVSVNRDGGKCELKDDGSGCVGEAYVGETVPLDIYIMFDQSGSTCSCIDPPMTSNACPDPACRKTRLDGIREAAGLFLDDPKSAGIGVGIGYFGTQPIGQASCNPADYTNAAVGIAPLPGNAANIKQSLSGIRPTGETPSAAAIRGACTYTRQWSQSNPDHKVVILLLTDGKPEAPVTCRSGTCCPTIEDTVAAATECATGNPQIETYVLGVGPLLQNLEQIAIAGGTKKAYLVEGNDVSKQVLDALNAIRGAASIPCDLALPPAPAGQRLDLTKVNIVYADSACTTSYIHNVPNVGACGPQGGWYYDNPTAPQGIHLCPVSCDQVSTNPGGQLVYTVGCTTITVPQ